MSKLIEARKHLLLPREKELVEGEVLAILQDIHTGAKRIYRTKNIVTDAGDTYYAQQAANETPTNAFDRLELGSAGTPGKAATTSSFTLIASTSKAPTATYPRTNDPDSDNTGDGADVVTWQFAYAAGDFNHAAITHGWICINGHGAGAPILTGFAFSGGAFAKTASDTLKVIINHTFTGV